MTYPIQELDELEVVINASRRMLETLEQRRDRLLQDLDHLTRPIPPHSTPTTRWLSPRVEFKGETRLKYSLIDLYTCALEFLWNERPDLRHDMASAMSSCGTTRKYVATTREDLFSGQSGAWAKKHSRVLAKGWYLDTNINLERMKRVLHAAVRASGLLWGQDIRVQWKSMKSSIE
ncbi:hypothetical protein [Ideonella sp.]|uniref:hypothetical protein n=1 Tax=Ideonella sp. TaxID=1929293 RepID=UPI0037C17076